MNFFKIIVCLALILSTLISQASAQQLVCIEITLTRTTRVFIRQVCLATGRRRIFYSKTVETLTFSQIVVANVCVRPPEADAFEAGDEADKPLEEDGGSCGGDSVGEPHFKTWDGTRYSYHGECDMVMTDSPTYSSGLGLAVHIRTAIRDNYSYISNAAVSVGDDVFEVQSDGTSFINGQQGNPELLLSGIEGHPIKSISQCLDKKTTGEASSSSLVAVAGEACEKPREEWIIALETGEDIRIQVFKGLVNVHVNAMLPGSAGLMGSPSSGIGGMLARNGKTVFSDPNNMGNEWQVRDKEAHLFNEKRAPQFPELCILPEANAENALREHDIYAAQAATAEKRRRLTSKSELEMLAEDACTGAPKAVMADCVFDVVQTGDIDLAQTYTIDF